MIRPPSKNKIAVRRRLTAVNCPRSQAQRKSRVRSIIFQFFAESEKVKNNLPFTCKPAIVEREQSVTDMYIISCLYRRYNDSTQSGV